MDLSLITEGTYPFHDGGVSVWCDQLVRGLSPDQVQLRAITVTGMERPSWELPANVSSLQRVALWGPTAIRHSSWRLDPRIRAALEPFLMAITSPSASSSDFVDQLRLLHRVARAGRLQAALSSEDAVDLMIRAMQAHAPRGRSISRFPTQPTIADAVASLNLLEHLLRPLSCPAPAVDVCHASSNGVGVLLAMGAKWERQTPFVLTEHGIYLRERYIAYGPETMPHPQRAFLLSFLKHLTAAAYQVADVIAPGSEYNRLWEQANGAAPDKIRPIYNGIDALSFTPPSSEPNVPTLAWVGRIDPLKDVKTLLRAFGRVLRVMPEAKLRIFGGTPKGNEAYQRECLDLHQRLGLGSSAVFEGRVPSIMDAYHAGHVVVATSISEGFPYAVIEAMASARAMVATDVGGVREAIADAGILVPPRDDAAIAEACIELLVDSERRARLARAGRDRVLSLFTLEMCINRYREVYESVRFPTDALDASRTVSTPAPVAVGRLLNVAEVAGVSAAVTEDCWEAEPNDPSVREWLDRLTVSGFDVATGDDDPVMAVVCGAAVDPLEIAAALETAGMSHQLVNDTYGHPDVFTLARQLWVQVPFKSPVTVTPWIQRPGGWRDLARGGLYAAPAVILFALAHGLHLELEWWTLSLALTWGWGLGQITAYCGYTLRGRGNAAAEAETGGWLFLVAVASTIDIAAVAVILLGGDLSSILVAAGVTAYMVASAILLLHDEEWLAAALLAPALVGSLLVVVASGHATIEAIAVCAILGSAAATVIGAARHLRVRWHGDFGLGATDVRIALAHLTHGVICGIALSVLAIEGARIYAGTISPALLALPLLLTLGVMEWQLRTYKSSVAHLMRGHSTLEEFKPMAWLVFQRSLGIYIAASLVVSAVVVVAIYVSDQSPPYSVMAAQVVLGATYFLDLTIVSVGRLDLVLNCWLLGGVGALWFASCNGFQASIPGEVLAWRSAFVAVAVTFCSLLFYARRVAPAAISH